jgi:nucleoside-diphosphate-sugar epimerase
MRLLAGGSIGVFNVGGDSRITLGDLALRIAGLCDAEYVEPEEQEQSIGSPDLVELDLTKTLREVGPISFTNLDSGLKNTVSWYKSLLDENLEVF